MSHRRELFSARRVVRGLSAAIVRPFQFLLYYVSGWMPRDPRVWVFGSWAGRRFADNAKWLFLHCTSEPAPGVRVVWISRDRTVVRLLRSQGLEACHAYSPKGLYYSLRAGLYVFDSYANDVNFWTSRRATKVNLWHGIPLKKIERSVDTPGHHLQRAHAGSLLERAVLRFLLPWQLDRYDLIISTSPRVSGILREAFGVSDEEVAITGYPRNDVLIAGSASFDSQVSASGERIRQARQSGRRVVAYLPTFRDQASRQEAPPIEWQRLAHTLQDSGALLVVKLHSVDRSPVLPNEASEQILVASSREDIYVWLRDVDILITDYSSVYFDYLLLNRPIVFYAYDLERYTSRDRSFYFDYESVTPGSIARSFTELLTILRSLLQGHDRDATRRRNILHEFHTYTDEHSSQRIVEVICARFLCPKRG